MKFNYRNKEADKNYLCLRENPQKIPFYFTYANTEYQGFGSDDFKLINTETTTNGQREDTVFEYLLKDVLTVTVLLTHYYSHGATEWTVYFENKTDKNTDVISNYYSKITLEGEKPVLKGILGDHENKYTPYEYDLTKDKVNFVSDTGRATHIYFPYFNIEYADKGCMFAIGWGGTWEADFRSENNITEYTAKSVNNFNTYIKPGEKIRTALFLSAPYTVRNEFYATNYWRNFYIECNMPKADKEGNPIEPFSTVCLANDTGLVNTDGSISERYFTYKPSIDKMIEEDVKVDFRWFDAGWYIAPDKTTVPRDWWGTVGTWVLDSEKWPGKTFLESTDYARSHGMKTLMWFEPERTTNPEALEKNFGYKKEWAIEIEGVRGIANNIGNQECFDWTVGQITKTLRENKVEMYREDNNYKSAVLWEYLDKKEGEGRLGITESKLLDAHYRMWDIFIDTTLSYGGCGFVDSCASGGGRNDIESMRRGIPLLRSDADRTSTALRLSMSSSFHRWIPFCGAATREQEGELSSKGICDVYTWRASYLAVLNCNAQYTQDPETDFDMIRFGLREWDEIKKYFSKDFYYLTPFHTHTDKEGFTSFMYYDNEENTGVLYAFRQEECEENTLEITIPSLVSDKNLILTDRDTNEELVTKDNALTITFPSKRCAKLFMIKEIK